MRKRFAVLCVHESVTKTKVERFLYLTKHVPMCTKYGKSVNWCSSSRWFSFYFKFYKFIGIFFVFFWDLANFLYTVLLYDFVGLSHFLQVNSRPYSYGIFIFSVGWMIHSKTILNTSALCKIDYFLRFQTFSWFCRT